MSEPPDVDASRLTRRVAGLLSPDAARLRYVVAIPLDWRSACQVCDAQERLVIFDHLVDRNNGQRIPVGLCLLCLARGVALFDDPPPPAVKPRKRGGRP